MITLYIILIQWFAIRFCPKRGSPDSRYVKQLTIYLVQMYNDCIERVFFFIFFCLHIYITVESSNFIRKGLRSEYPIQPHHLIEPGFVLPSIVVFLCLMIQGEMRLFVSLILVELSTITAQKILVILIDILTCVNNRNLL